MTIAVRRAETKDVEWILEQLKDLSDFFGSKQSLYGDKTHARIQIEGLLSHHLLLVAESKEKGLIGFVGGFVAGHPFNPEIKLLAEVIWWIDKSAHGKWVGKKAGLLLLDAFTKFGKENCDWVTFGLQRKSPIGKNYLFRQGYVTKELSFILEVA